MKIYDPDSFDPDNIDCRSGWNRFISKLTPWHKTTSKWPVLRVDFFLIFGLVAMVIVATRACG